MQEYNIGIDKIKEKLNKSKTEIGKFDMLDIILKSEQLRNDYKVTVLELIELFDEINLESFLIDLEQIRSEDKEGIREYIIAIRSGVMFFTQKILDGDVEKNDLDKLNDLKVKYYDFLKNINDMLYGNKEENTN